MTRGKAIIGTLTIAGLAAAAFALVMLGETTPLLAWAAPILFVLALVQAALQLTLLMEAGKGNTAPRWIALGGGVFVAGLTILFLTLLE